MRETLSTDSVAPEQRLAYWIDSICSTYVQLDCDPGATDCFQGAIHSHSLPGLALSVVRSGAQRVQRTPRAIAQSDDAHLLVSVQTRGQGLLLQDGREAVLTPGDFALYDSTRPYTLRFDADFEQIVLKMRATQLQSLLRHTEQLTASTVSGRSGAGQLLCAMAHNLRDQAEALQPASAAAVVHGVLHVLAASLQALPACTKAEPSVMRAYHMARILRRIDERVHEPTLTIASIAAELGMSAGHLHRLFRNEPLSPAQYLWTRRLEACSRELLDPRRAHASVAEIAFSWGFNDASHFSRSFREHFHMSPREWRWNAHGQGEKAPNFDENMTGRQPVDTVRSQVSATAYTSAV